MDLNIREWKNLSEEDRQVIIIKLAYKFEFGFKLSFKMPEGHETDNGFYDKNTNILYFNYELTENDNSLNPIYTLLVEIRKYMQLTNKVTSDIIKRSLNYVFLFNGTVYRNFDGELIEVDLEGEKKYLKQLYVTAPNTFDFNCFAYKNLFDLIKDNSELVEELNSIYDYWKPTFEFFSESEIENVYTELFDSIDEQAKKQL